jgi:hypothetical protein
VLATSGGDFGVIEYRAYFIGHDGHFNGYEPLVCADDETAIEMAIGQKPRAHLVPKPSAAWSSWD